VQDETGGFTEFVLLPFVHHSSPIYLAGVARPGPTVRENRAVHAVARLLLHGRIPNIQTSWVKLGDVGTQAVLQGGANDLGGTLMEETISRMAGSENGSLKTIAELEAVAAAIGRPARQRTTEYGTPSAERLATARSEEGRSALTLKLLRGPAETTGDGAPGIRRAGRIEVDLPALTPQGDDASD
jgi:FO synthase